MGYETTPSDGAGIREFYKVVPSTATEATSNIDKHLTSLADLSKTTENNSGGVLGKLAGGPSEEPITFEFVALSQGKDEPVNLYYSSSGRQETLKKRLKAIYPSSFDIQKVHLDLGYQLIEPVKLTEQEFRARLKADQLYRDREEYLDEPRGGELGGARDKTEIEPGERNIIGVSSIPLSEHGENIDSEPDTTDADGVDASPVKSDGGAAADEGTPELPSGNTESNNSTTPEKSPISTSKYGGEVNPIALAYIKSHDTVWHRLDGDPFFPTADKEPSLDVQSEDRLSPLVEAIDLPDSSTSDLDDAEANPNKEEIRFTLPHYPDGVNPVTYSYNINQKSRPGPENDANRELQVGEDTVKFVQRESGRYIGMSRVPNIQTKFSVGYDGDDNDSEDDQNDSQEAASHPLADRAPGEGELPDEKPIQQDGPADTGTGEMLIIDDEEEDGTPIRGIVRLNPPEDIPDNEPIATLDGPTLTEDGHIYVRPDIEYTEPNAVRWYGKESAPRDWMTTLDTATESNPEYEDGNVEEDVEDPDALETLFSHLEEAASPTAYQAVFRAKPSWEHEAQSQKQDIRRGEFNEPILEKLFPTETDGDRDLKAYEYRRIKLIENKRPTETFNVNLRAISLAPKTDFTNDSSDPTQNPHEQQAEIRETLHTLTPLFDPLDGIYYSIDGEVVDKQKSVSDFSHDPTADKVVTNFFERNLILRKDLRGAFTPFNITNDPKKHVEIVMNGRELGEFIIIPSGDDMDSDVFRSTGVRDADIEPLTRPRPEIHKKFSEGMELGYAYDEHGHPEDTPTCLPEGKLPNHWAMFGSSGSGKTVNAISMLLSAHRDTDGPVILVDPKEGDMIENYAKSHYGTFGDLRDVYVFDVPDVLPAIPFFDIRPYLYEGMDRDNAIQQKVDEFHLILQMIDENYGTAYVAKTVLGALIKSQFDAEHGADAYTLDDLYETAVEMYANQRVPRVSHQPQVRNILTSQLNNSESEFKNTMQAVINRLDDLQEDINLYHLFNQNPHWDDEKGVYESNGETLDDYDPTDERSKTPKNALDFRKILDEDVVVLFDTGDFVRDQSQQAFSMYILSALWGRVRSRHKDNRSHETIDSTVKLVIEESAPIVSTELVTNTLIPEGREFGLSLGMIMQFPDQVSDQGVGGSFNELKTNVQTKIYGQIDPNRQVADSLIHGDKDVSTIKNKIRRLRGGEWIAQLPEPEFGVDVPPPFSLQSLNIPRGHPAGNRAFDDSQRQKFYRQFDQRITKTAKEHGITQAERNVDLSDVEDDNVNAGGGADSSGGDSPGDAGGGQTRAESRDTTSSGRSSPADADQPDSEDAGDEASGGGGWGDDFASGESTARVEPDADAQQPDETADESSDTVALGETDMLDPDGSADSDSSGTQQDSSASPDSSPAASDNTDSIYDDVAPIPNEQISDICTQTDFSSLDEVQAAVFAVEDQYNPTQQPDKFRRALKRLAVEAQAYGHDITGGSLEDALSESGRSADQHSDGDVTVDDIDATDDAGVVDANDVDADETDEDPDSTFNYTSPATAQAPPEETESAAEDAEDAPSGDTPSEATNDPSGPPQTGSHDSDEPDTAEDTTPADAPTTANASATDEAEATGADGSEATDTDDSEAADTNVATDESTESAGTSSSENGDWLREELSEWKVSDDPETSLSDIVESAGSGGEEGGTTSRQEETTSEEEAASEEGHDSAEPSTGQVEDGAESATETDEDPALSPADVSVKSPLNENQTLLTKHKRESVDLSKDDIKFLALVADAFRDDLEGYSLHESMKQLESRAGNPDIDGLEADGYIESTKIYRRKYYSLTRKAWRLVNDGVPGNKFGDHMEKITHRYGVYLTAQFLETFPGLSAVEYESLDGETFDVVSYDDSGDIRHVCEVETSSNNADAVVEDYHKLADAPGKSVWIFPGRDAGGEVRAKLESEDLVEDTKKTVKTKAKNLHDYVKENPTDGMAKVHFYHRLRDQIGV